MNVKQIKQALQSEFPDAEPSPRVWAGIQSSLPRLRSFRLKLAAGLASLIVLSMAGVGVAKTDAGKDLLDWVFQRFGIHLVDGKELFKDAPPLKPEEMPQPVKPDELKGKLPAGMKLPTYLPSMGDVRQKLQLWEGGAGVSWSAPGRHLLVGYHDHAFGPGSRTGTNGEAREIQEVKVNGTPGLAFRDDFDWHLEWVLEGHQYEVLTDISLEEALKVAESIK